MHKLIAVPVLLTALTGCAGFAFGTGQPMASLYTNVESGMRVTENKLGRKEGEACASSILGLVTTGDASIRAAADAGNVVNIGAVDQRFTNILGLYAKYCTIVSGTAGGAGGE